METLLNPDWQSAFVPGTSLIELFIRGTLTYLAVFLMLRFVLMRQAGAVGMADLLVIVMIADAAQNAMSDDYRSIPEGLVVVGTIIFWAYSLDWLGYHFPWFQQLVSPAPLLLVKDGQLLWTNMRRELISRDELLSQMRLQGIEDLNEIHEAFMESDGRISFITHEHAQHNREDQRQG